MYLCSCWRGSNIRPWGKFSKAVDQLGIEGQYDLCKALIELLPLIPVSEMGRVVTVRFSEGWAKVRIVRMAESSPYVVGFWRESQWKPEVTEE